MKVCLSICHSIRDDYLDWEGQRRKLIHFHAECVLLGKTKQGRLTMKCIESVEKQ